MSTTTRAMTEAELMALPRDGRKRELVDGEIRVMSPAGFRHCVVAINLAALLAAFVKEHGLGYVAGSQVGFWMPSGNLRVPDLSFVAAHRFPHGVPEGFSPVVPDLAVEVLSPGDTQREILDKVGEYLASGVRLVWVVDPRARKAVAHRSLTDVREVAEDGDLDGEDVVPGFRCRLGEILA